MCLLIGLYPAPPHTHLSQKDVWPLTMTHMVHPAKRNYKPGQGGRGIGPGDPRVCTDTDVCELCRCFSLAFLWHVRAPAPSPYPVPGFITAQRK